jgi:hypothetical protein
MPIFLWQLSIGIDFIEKFKALMKNNQNTQHKKLYRLYLVLAPHQSFYFMMLDVVEVGFIEGSI